MKNVLLFVSTVTLAFVAPNSYGFGGKPMRLTDIKGTTETQVAKSMESERVEVMIRGQAAKLLFSTMREEAPQEVSTEALKLVKAKYASHWFVKGKQISCSRIAAEKGKKEDYACSFAIDNKGEVALGVEPFHSGTFNLARTETGLRFKNQKGGRGLASISKAPVAFDKANAYLMHKEKVRESEEVMVLFRGTAAKELISFLDRPENQKVKSYFWGKTKGVRGREIACVHATAKEPERCALVVSMNDGSIDRSANPLMK